MTSIPGQMTNVLSDFSRKLGDRSDQAVQVTTVAGALVRTTKALVGIWAAGQPRANMAAMTRAALDQLDPVWPTWLADAPTEP